MIPERPMNLYLLTQTKVTGCDTYDSAVVAAGSLEEARGIHPAGPNGWVNDYKFFPAWPPSQEDVSVLQIGTALDGTKAGVILASYNEG